MKRRESLDFDLTPLLDVMFILVIFFIVSSVFKKEELVLVLDLPASNAKEAKIEQKQINIELSSTSLAFLGKKIDFTTLDERLKNVEDKSKPIIVRIDKTVPYERVVKLLDIFQKHDLNNLALITKKEEK
jgi:biopolymer transport protein ExbD